MQESIKPNKNLGQNFLKNKYTINTIFDILNISKSDHILEIGPGQVLTGLNIKIFSRENNSTILNLPTFSPEKMNTALEELI